MELPEHHQGLDSGKLKIGCQVLQFTFGVGKRRFVELGYDQGVALDANFQSAHFLHELLQRIVRGFETLEIFWVAMVIQAASVEQNLEIS